MSKPDLLEKRTRAAITEAERIAVEMLDESDETPKLELVVRFNYPGYGIRQESWSFEPVGSKWKKDIRTAIKRVGSMFLSWHIVRAKKPLSIEERDRILDEMEAEESAQ